MGVVVGIVVAVVVLGVMVYGRMGSPTCGVDPEQVRMGKIYGNREYLLYLRNSMNIPLENNKDYMESGVLERDGTIKKKCRKILSIFDHPGVVAKNNPYEIVAKGGNIYVLVVDQLGAGRGEGTAKIVKSEDGGQEWKLMSCFYYVPENTPKLEELVKSVPETVKSENCTNFVLSR